MDVVVGTTGMGLLRFPGHFTIFYLVIIKSDRAPLAIGYFVGGEVGTLWSRWPVQNVLVVLTILPLLGAVVLWFTKERQKRAP